MPLNQSAIIIPEHIDIFEKPASSINKIISELSKYSSNAIVQVCSKLSIVLNVEQKEALKVQARIARELLNDKHWENVVKQERLLTKREGGSGPRMALFHYVPVMMLLKLNLENNDESGRGIDSQDDMECLASWLLSLNHYFISPKNTSANVAEYHKERLRMFFARQFLVAAESDPFAHLIARSEKMLEFIKKDTRLDCSAIFLKTTGLTIDEYQDFTTFLLTGWRIAGEERNLDEITIRSISKYFENLNSSSDKIEKYIDLVSFTSDSYTHLQKNYSDSAVADPNDITNFICFINRPLMRFGDNFMCVSVNYLALKLTEGIYRILEEQLRAETGKRDLLSQIWSTAFENYIHERMEKIFGTAYTKNPPALKGSETIDGMVGLNKTVILMEYKHAHWSYRARFSANRHDMKDYYYKMFRYKPVFDRKKHKKIRKTKGLGQVRHYFDNVESGRYSSSVSFAYKKVLPVVVSSEELPFDPLNRMYLEGFASSQGCYIKDKTVLPFIVLSPEEVEILESEVEANGVEFIEQILTRYSQLLRVERTRLLSIPERPTSLRNELINEELQALHSDFMKKQLDNVLKRAEKRFRKASGKDSVSK